MIPGEWKIPNWGRKIRMFSSWSFLQILLFWSGLFLPWKKQRVWLRSPINLRVQPEAQCHPSHWLQVNLPPIWLMSTSALTEWPARESPTSSCLWNRRFPIGQRLWTKDKAKNLLPFADSLCGLGKDHVYSEPKDPISCAVCFCINIAQGTGAGNKTHKVNPL